MLDKLEMSHTQMIKGGANKTDECIVVTLAMAHFSNVISLSNCSRIRTSAKGLNSSAVGVGDR